MLDKTCSVLKGSFETFLTLIFNCILSGSTTLSLDLTFSFSSYFHQNPFNSYWFYGFLPVFFMDSILHSILGDTSVQHLKFRILALWSQVFPLSFGNTSWQHLHYCICYLTPTCLEPLPLYVSLCFLLFPSWHQILQVSCHADFGQNDGCRHIAEVG